MEEEEEVVPVDDEGSLVCVQSCRGGRNVWYGYSEDWERRKGCPSSPSFMASTQKDLRSRLRFFFFLEMTSVHLWRGQDDGIVAVAFYIC